MAGAAKKIKVMHIVSRFETGGMENGVVNILNNLDRTKFIPMLCAINGLGEMTKRLEKDVSVTNLNYSERKALLRPFSMSGYLKETKPDIVHTHGWGGGAWDGIISGKLAKTPVIINGLHGRLNYSRFQLLLQKFLELLCDATLAVSYSLKDKSVSKIDIPANRIRVIHNGVDESIFNGKYDTAELRSELKKNYGISINENSFVIGSIGTLKTDKNQKLLIDALINISKERDINEFKVLIVGDGPDRSLLEKMVADAKLINQVFFLGQHHNVYKLLALMNIVVSTSMAKSEGLSNVILEAMSSGVPVIATDSVGVSELINDTENGLIICRSEALELSKAIEFLADFSDVLKKMAIESRKYILDNFTLNKMVCQYAAIYEELFYGK